MPGQCSFPETALAPDHAIGNDVGIGGRFAQLRAGARVQRAQQLHGLFDRSGRLLQFGGDAGNAGARQAFQQWAGGNLPRQRQPRRGGGQGGQLQHQAFAQRARADADRVEMLDTVQ